MELLGHLRSEPTCLVLNRIPDRNGRLVGNLAQSLEVFLSKRIGISIVDGDHTNDFPARTEVRGDHGPDAFEKVSEPRASVCDEAPHESLVLASVVDDYGFRFVSDVTSNSRPQ